MKNILLVLIAILITSFANAQERATREKIKITNNILGELKSAKGWMLSPGSEWVSLDNTIPQELALSERNLLKFERIGLGVDNFISYQFREIMFRDTTYLLLLKKYRDGRFRYPNIKEDWIAYTSYYAYVLDKDEFYVEMRSIRFNEINKIELKVLARVMAIQKTEEEIRSYLIDDIDLREKNPTFIYNESCHMKLILHIAPYKEKNIVQFQIYSSCGDNNITYGGLSEEIFDRNKYSYGANELFEHCYYETSFDNFNKFMKLE